MAVIWSVLAAQHGHGQPTVRTAEHPGMVLQAMTAAMTRSCAQCHFTTLCRAAPQPGCMVSPGCHKAQS